MLRRVSCPIHHRPLRRDTDRRSLSERLGERCGTFRHADLRIRFEGAAVCGQSRYRVAGLLLDLTEKPQRVCLGPRVIARDCDVHPAAEIIQRDAGEQRAAIEKDFDMKDGRRDVEVRLSMAYYFIKRMNLDLTELPPERVQLFLSNLADVQREVEEARARAKRGDAEVDG